MTGDDRCEGCRDERDDLAAAILALVARAVEGERERWQGILIESLRLGAAQRSESVEILARELADANAAIRHRGGP